MYGAASTFLIAKATTESLRDKRADAAGGNRVSLENA
jgi:hypothetical protein